MSLFKWSTPERRGVDQILPIIPNEIYIYIFELVAPPTRRLTPLELTIFSRLSRVCRFFANLCLPRLFEFLEFCDPNISLIPLDDASRVAAVTLCEQIAAKQPLALSLAKRVRSCHFTNRQNYKNGPIANKYLAGILHMKNIRELRFSDNSFVREEHWSAIATLESLEVLSFESCFFKQGPADVDLEERVKVKVSRFRATGCDGHPPATAIHPQYLRVLAVNISFFDHVDWLPQTDLIELHLHFTWPYGPRRQERVHTLLTHAPQSLETLALSVFASFRTTADRDILRSMFADPAWKKLSGLRSLTLALYLDPDRPEDLSFVLDCISLLTDLQSFILKGLRDDSASEISPTEVRCILHDKLGPSSSLTYIDIYGKVFCLVDGEWSDASCSMM